MASSKQILGGFLLGLSRGAETFFEEKQNIADRKQQEELFELRQQDAKIELESSRLQLQILQGQLEREPFNQDLILQERRARIDASRASTAIRQAELADIPGDKGRMLGRQVFGARQ